MQRLKLSRLSAIFLILLAMIGVWTTADYGQPIDEQSEMNILLQNVKEYAISILGADSQIVCKLDKYQVERISTSIERDHGQSAYYPFGFLWLYLHADQALLMRLWHLYTWFLFMVGVVSLYFLARELKLNRLLACMTALLLYLSPRFFAEGHYNNKDVVLLSLVLWTLAAGSRYIRKPTWKGGVVFALAGAFATNTKIVGAFAWGLVTLASLFHRSQREESVSRRLSRVVGIAGLYLLFVLALTPAMWPDPVGYMAYVLRNATGFSRWTGIVLFKGMIYDQTHGAPLPHSYLPTMMAVTIPVGFLLLIGIGQISAFKRCLNKDPQWPLLMALTVLWALPLAYVVIKQPIMYNGWRHFYFIYAGLAAIGGLGIQRIVQWSRSSTFAKRVVSLVFIGLFAFPAYDIVANHPYQYVYYNILPSNVSQNFEMDYWEVSTANAITKLLEAEPTSAGIINISGRDEMSRLSLQNCYLVLDRPSQERLRVTSSSSADYLFENSMYARIYGSASPEGYEKYIIIQGFGNDICVIYRSVYNQGAMTQQ